MIIKTTKNESIASVHTGSMKNTLEFYTLLKTLLEDDIDIFTIPNQKPKSKEIEWSIEEDDQVISFKEADEETKEFIKRLLKEKLEKILENRNSDQIEILKNALEIPDEDDIHLVGGKRVVLTNWGHIKNRFDAKRQIIFNLIGDIYSIIKFTILKDQKPISNCKVTFIWDNFKKEIFSNDEGKVQIKIPLNKKVSFEVKCENNNIIGEIFTDDKVISKEIILEENKKESKTFSISEIFFKWWWLLLLLLGIGGAGVYYFAFNKPKDLKIYITWNEEFGDFDLHLIDNCGNIVDNFHKEDICKKRKIIFKEQSQGFNCPNKKCQELIIAKNGLKDGEKIVINQYSSKKSPGKVTLLVKRSEEIVLKKDFIISSPHPMLEKLNPNNSDIIFIWKNET
jgi:hypothetical protein